MTHVFLDVTDDLIFLPTGKNGWVTKPVLVFLNSTIANRVSIEHLAFNISDNGAHYTHLSNRYNISKWICCAGPEINGLLISGF
jgi:hypothetical protein